MCPGLPNQLKRHPCQKTRRTGVAAVVGVQGVIAAKPVGLSDPGLEKQLARDLMFRRFINLGLLEGVPDHSVSWRFRDTPTKQDLQYALLSGPTNNCRP